MLNISFNSVEVVTAIVETSCEIIMPEDIEKLIDTLTESTLFPEEFYERLIDSKEVNKTRFEDACGGIIEILHASEILILLLDQNGNYIDQSLEKVVPFKKRNEENRK